MEGIEDTVRKIASAIRDNYVREDVANSVAGRIEGYIGSDSWKRAVESESLYRILANLNCILTSETDDGHFKVTTGAGAGPIRVDGGIERYTPHYVRVREFQGLYDEFTRMSWVKVFDQLQDPVVFDLRECPGGSPELAYFLLCHLFPDGTPLMELQTRNAAPQIFRAASEFPFYTTFNGVKKFGGRVRVLINAGTASAAESFAYAVQHRGRGKLFGTRSAGHAHVTYTSRVGGLFLHLPYGRTCDPDTHEDWEGVGLRPDYPVGSPEYIQLIYSEIANYTMTPVDPVAR